MVKDNYKLGDFTLEGLSQKPKGDVSVEVTFDVDVSGLMHVTAIETANKVTKSIVIKYDNNRLKSEEILKMQQDALLYEAQDGA
jgi:molecular chaperone DnaK (HSP70)